jgi:hypothetical protein
MSMKSEFLTKHSSLADQLAAQYPDYIVAKSESELALGNFPAIGIFLGSSEHSKESISYIPIVHTYILCVFDAYDMDSATDMLEKQRVMFDLLEDIIDKMSFNVLTDIEPEVSIGIDFGTFITGWTCVIKF